MAEQYTYGAAPIIQAGVCYQSSTVEGTPSTITFNTAFPTDNVYVTVTPLYCSNVQDPMVSPSIANVSSTGFDLYSWYKTGAGDNDGGGWYYGSFHFIAVCQINASTIGTSIDCGYN